MDKVGWTAPLPAPSGGKDDSVRAKEDKEEGSVEIGEAGRSLLGTMGIGCGAGPPDRQRSEQTVDNPLEDPFCQMGTLLDLAEEIVRVPKVFVFFQLHRVDPTTSSVIHVDPRSIPQRSWLLPHFKTNA